VRLVIDASAAVYLAASETGFAALARYELVAPPLVRSEATSAIHQAVWRGQASPELAEGTFQALLSAPIHADPVAGLLERAWKIADDLGWAKTYDAEYVALAQLIGCGLLTVDARLIRGAGHLVRMVDPADV
jgi:predicted nucleic acid-binding protein